MMNVLCVQPFPADVLGDTIVQESLDGLALGKAGPYLCAADVVECAVKEELTMGSS